MYNNCCQGVAIVMETLLCLGLLAHASKIKWPTSAQRFCGFLHNSLAIPRIEVPTDKQDNALALLAYLESRPEPLFRLMVLVVVGRLQRLLPINPAYFYCPAIMTKEAFANVMWWKEYLSTNPCAISCLPDPDSFHANLLQYEYYA
eukprot:5936632-Ditylum_brightwellii.AAC.1